MSTPTAALPALTTERHPTMRDADMPIIDRIKAAIERITNGYGQMRVPVEATDPDIVLQDCRITIERLEAALAAQAEAHKAELQRMQDEFDKASLAMQDEINAVQGELDQVLGDWNALVAASGSKTNGGAVGHVTALRAENSRMQSVVSTVNARCDYLGITLGEIKRERDALKAALLAFRMAGIELGWGAHPKWYPLIKQCDAALAARTGGKA
jgi:hypothetical protein